MPQHPKRSSDGWLLVSDVDDTLVGNSHSLQQFCQHAREAEAFRFVLNSSRPIDSVKKTLGDLEVQLPASGIIGAMGTEILLDESLDAAWRQRFEAWDRSIIDAIMAQLGAEPHADEFQTPFKASFAVPRDRQQEAKAAIDTSGLPSRIVISGESDFDVLPKGAGKGEATLRCAERLGYSQQQLIVAGDSANDLDMFIVSARGILVGNARSELRLSVDPASTYAASQPFAAGVIEGLTHWGVFPR